MIEPAKRIGVGPTTLIVCTALALASGCAVRVSPEDGEPWPRRRVIATAQPVPAPPAVAPQPEPANPCFLWEITTPRTTMFLVGSVHAVPGSVFPLDPTIERAFDRAAGLVVEVDLLATKPEQLQADLAAAALLPADQSLATKLSPATYARLTAALARHGVPLAGVQRLQPWLVGLMVAQLELAQLGYEPANGIDLHFLHQAVGRKRILPLETPEFQLQLFTGLSDPLQELLVADATRPPAELRAELETMMFAWRSGDAALLDAAMMKHVREQPELRPVYERILFARNASMTAKLEPLLASGETWFVVVGAGHLVGDRGIVRLLQQRGYSVRQLSKAAAAAR